VTQVTKVVLYMVVIVIGLMAVNVFKEVVGYAYVDNGTGAVMAAEDLVDDEGKPTVEVTDTRALCTGTLVVNQLTGMTTFVDAQGGTQTVGAQGGDGDDDDDDDDDETGYASLPPEDSTTGSTSTTAPTETIAAPKENWVVVQVVVDNNRELVYDCTFDDPADAALPHRAALNGHVIGSAIIDRISDNRWRLNVRRFVAPIAYDLDVDEVPLQIYIERSPGDLVQIIDRPYTVDRNVELSSRNLYVVKMVPPLNVDERGYGMWRAFEFGLRRRPWPAELWVDCQGGTARACHYGDGLYKVPMPFFPISAQNFTIRCGDVTGNLYIGSTQ